MSQKLVLVTTGDVDPRIAEELRADLETSTGLVVIRGADISLEPDDKSPRGNQYRSSLILYHLPEIPADEYLLVLTAADIYAGSLNFIFGHADGPARKAVVSMARLAHDPLRGPATPETLRRRLLTEGLREVGHMRGLEDCDNSTCAMYFSFTLYDTDNKSPSYCARCRSLLS